MQNAIALLLVVACVAYVAWQLFKTVRAGTGKAGSCCSKGCGSETTAAPSTSSREQFIAADSLRRRRA